MLIRQFWLCVLMAAGIVLAVAPRARAIQPADPDLIPEGRRLLEYLKSIEGKKIIAGKQKSGGGTGAFEIVLHMTGREPALRGGDIAGFNPKGSDAYHQVMRGSVADIKWWWQEKGGIYNILYHCGNPMHPNGTAWKGRPEGSTPPDIGKMVTPGTEEYKTFHEKLKFTADYLAQLAEARVPLLFAPLHEIDGGWFWWTDVEKPENTAALYRQTFNYLVKERKIHNLIWVYHAAHSCNWIQGQRVASRGGWNSPDRDRPVNEKELEEEIAFRRRYYPGDQFVDIGSLSTYGNRQLGWGYGWEDARQQAYKLMQGIAPGKPLAINEAPEPIHPLIAKQEGLNWLWSRAWYNAPADWMRYVYNHEHMITLDELPLLHDGNVTPNVRIEWPNDGLDAGPGEISLAGFASDRNGNLESVSVYVLSEPWLDYTERNDPAVKDAFAGAIRLGEARLGTGGRWTFTWQSPPAGFHNIVAFARDADGAVASSNVVRLSVAITNLARGKEATASIHQAGQAPAGAVDGDLNTAWWAGVPRRHDGVPVAQGPQWLQVDLEKERTIGAVSVLWWKGYAKDYAVQVSSDGQAWREVGRVEGRQKPLGDSDVIRFEPVQARYVRLYCTQPAVDWQTYCVSDFGVYESLPKTK